MELLDISSWWQGLAGFEKTFWAIAIIFSALFLLQTIYSFLLVTQMMGVQLVILTQLLVMIRA